MRLTRRGQNVVIGIMIMIGGVIGVSVNGLWWNENVRVENGNIVKEKVVEIDKNGIGGGAIVGMNESVDRHCLMECGK